MQFRRVNPLPYGEVYTIVDGICGRGQYVGTSMGVGVNNSHISYLRSVASSHLQNMAERMRANPAGVDASDYAGNVPSPANTWRVAM